MIRARTRILPDGNRLVSADFQTGWIINEIYGLGVYDKFFPIQQGMTVLDIGAHVGIFTLKVAKKVGSLGRVVAVEANPMILPFLEHNIVRNGYQNITVIPYAVSNVESTAKFYANLWCTGGSTVESSPKTLELYKNFSRVFEVSVRRLDNILMEHEFFWFDLLKIDVEGLELEALEGLGFFLNNVRWLSIAAYHYPNEVEAISEFLLKSGFNCFSEQGFLYAQKKSF